MHGVKTMRGSAHIEYGPSHVKTSYYTGGAGNYVSFPLEFGRDRRQCGHVGTEVEVFSERRPDDSLHLSRVQPGRHQLFTHPRRQAAHSCSPRRGMNLIVSPSMVRGGWGPIW